MAVACLFGSASCTKQGAGEAVTPNDTNVQSGVVKGKVIDSQGKPLNGAEVVASSSIYYNSTAVGYSDANGNYKIGLPTGPAVGSYYVRGTAKIKFDGLTYRLPLFTEDDGTFMPADGAIKNLRLKLSGDRTGNFGDDGFYGGTVEVNNHTLSPYIVMKDIELAFKPQLLLDGSAGQTVRGIASGLYIYDVPLGRYQVSARQLSTGKALQVRIRAKDQDYQANVTGFFEAPFQGSERYQMDVEVTN